MSAQHIATVAIVVDIAREKAIREAMERFVAAADDLARVAGADRIIDIDLGICPLVYEVAVRAGWRNYVNPGAATGRPFGVASTPPRPLARVTVFGPDIPKADLAPTADANPIVIRPLGLGV